MHTSSLLLLLGAAATVAILHSILPDHWIPLAVVARTQRWSLLRVARVSAVASAGHVIASLVLGGIIALIGLQFQRALDTQQGHIIGGILVLTGLGFLLWGLFGTSHGHSHTGEGHTHDHDFEHTQSRIEAHEHNDHGHGHEEKHEHNEHEHNHEVEHDHTDHNHEEEAHAHNHPHERDYTPTKPVTQQTLAGKLAAIAVPFGIAASPDLTILPVVLAASAVGGGAVLSVLGVFSVLTIGTFIALTVLATLAGYQIKAAWLENNANTITSLVLIAIGVVAFIGF
ncbi:MAG: hypothetical protein NVS4B11_39990 [Ktedonobacteraceae bacterium]